MPLPTGRYRILNFQWNNLLVLRDGTDRSELFGYVPGLEDEECGDQWDIVALKNDRFKIRNVMHGSYMSCGLLPEDGQYVLGKSEPQDWYIVWEYGSSRASYTMSPSLERALYCSLELVNHATPVSLSSEPYTNRCNQWYFEPCITTLIRTPSAPPHAETSNMTVEWDRMSTISNITGSTTPVILPNHPTNTVVARSNDPQPPTAWEVMSAPSISSGGWDLLSFRSKANTIPRRAIISRVNDMSQSISPSLGIANGAASHRWMLALLLVLDWAKQITFDIDPESGHVQHPFDTSHFQDEDAANQITQALYDTIFGKPEQFSNPPSPSIIAFGFPEPPLAVKRTVMTSNIMRNVAVMTEFRKLLGRPDFKFPPGMRYTGELKLFQDEYLKIREHFEASIGSLSSTTAAQIRSDLTAIGRVMILAGQSQYDIGPIDRLLGSTRYTQYLEILEALRFELEATCLEIQYDTPDFIQNQYDVFRFESVRQPQIETGESLEDIKEAFRAIKGYLTTPGR